MLVDYSDNEDSDENEDNTSPKSPVNDPKSSESVSSVVNKDKIEKEVDNHVKEVKETEKKEDDDSNSDDWILPPRCTIREDAAQIVVDENYTVYGRIAHLLHVQNTTGRHLGVYSNPINSLILKASAFLIKVLS